VHHAHKIGPARVARYISFHGRSKRWLGITSPTYCRISSRIAAG
jgi:hypothetical protein